MRRRTFLSALGCAVCTTVAPAHSEQRVAVIGYLSMIISFPELLDEMRRGLAETGFVEGGNLRIEYRMAAGNYDRLPALAAELVRSPVDVIVAAGGSLSGIAAKAATNTIPIVVISGEDPVKLGLAQSLARPGGNLTGVSQLVVAADAKRLELLHELVLAAGRIAHLVNPTNAEAERRAGDLASAAGLLGVELRFLKASKSEDFVDVFDTIARQELRALNIGADPFFISVRDELVALAQRHAVPTMYFFREFVGAGGLISYGSKLSGAYRQVGVYAGRILEGAKPADLPIVQQSEQLELVINLKTADALHLPIPPTLRARADEVIE